MGLLTKTKEYVIKLFDSTLLGCKVASQVSVMRIAYACLFIAVKVR